MSNNLTDYLGGGEQAANVGNAVEPFLPHIWIVGAAARSKAYGAPKPDVHLIGVEYSAGPRLIDVIGTLGFVDDGHGNWKGEVDGKKTTFYGVNIGHYLTTTVFAGDGIAIRMDSGAAVVTPEFWVREADTQLRPYATTEDEVQNRKLQDMFEQAQADLADFKQYLQNEADRLSAMGITTDAEGQLKAVETVVADPVQQTDVQSGEQQLELEIAGKN